MWMKLSAVLAAMTLFVPALQAETLQTCATLTDTAKRLECYDGLAVKEVAPVVIPQTKSEWSVRVTTSPIDDSKKVFLQVVGVNGVTTRYGQEGQLILTLACRENVTSAYISFGGHFMSDLNGSGRVTYRVDDKSAQRKSFSESNDHEALGLWNGGSAIPWIKSLFGGNRMYVEATPFSENAVSDFLPIAGLEDAIAPLRDACGW